MFKFFWLGISMIFLGSTTVGSAEYKWIKTRHKPKLPVIMEISETENDVDIVYPLVSRKLFEAFIKDYQKHRKVTRRVIKRIVDQIFEHSEADNFNPLIILSMEGVESAYKYWVEGKIGEKGLGQINPLVWLSLKNKHNLYNAGIITEGKEYQLIWIGKNVKSHTYILELKRKICLKWQKRRGGLIRKGYKSLEECYIRTYNGSNRMMSREYYEKVTSMMGRYYLFVSTQK